MFHDSHTLCAGKGGCIWVDKATKVEMKDVHTRHCLGTTGGCIAINDAKVLASNVVAASGSSTAGGCMALENVVAQSRLSNVEVVEGVATDKGGALLCSNSHASFENVTLRNSSAPYGGGYAAFGFGGCDFLGTCTVADNSAGVIGGGVYVGDDAQVVLHNCTIARNTAASTAGGVAISSRGNVSLTGSSSVMDNRCAAAGGGFSVTGTATLAVSNSRITRNRAATGGGVSVAGNSHATFDFTAVVGNVAKLSGGGIAASVMGSVGNTNCEFAHNSAGVGGALSSSSGAAWSLRACHFTSNRANGTGGAALASMSSPMRFSDSTFENNTALDDGGGVHVGASTHHHIVAAQTGTAIDLAGCLFLHNTAAGRGGAVSINSGAALVHIVGCSMESNEADVGGGVALTQVKSARMDQCNLTSNAAAHGGGAWIGTNATLSNVRIVRNTAAYYGGGVFSESSGMLMTSVVMTHNGARHGAGATIVGNAVVSTLDLAHNTARETGGGLYVEQAGTGGSDMATLRGITAWENVAGVAGDGVFLSWADGLQDFEPRRPTCVDCSWRHRNDTASNSTSIATGWASLPHRILGDQLDSTHYPGELFSLTVRAVDVFNNTVRAKELLERFRVRVPVLAKCSAKYPALVPASHSEFTHIEGFALSASPGSQCWFQVESTPLRSGFPRPLNVSNVISSCPKGTEARTVSSGSVDDVQCRRCDANFYNLVPGSTCAPCPNALLCFGGNDVRVKAQHYATMPDTIASNDQLQVLRCRPGFCCRKGQCSLSDPGTWCRANRTGVLCGQCANGTVPVAASCVKCEGPNWPLLLMFGFGLFFFTLGTIAFTTTRSDPFFLLLTFGFQMTGIIMPSGKVEAVANTLAAIGVDVTSWDKLMDMADDKTCFAPFPALQGILFDLAMPAVALLSLVILCGMHYALYNRCCRKRRDCWGHWAWKWSVPRYKLATLRWVLTFYSLFCDTAVRLLHCVHVKATGKSYLVAQPSVVCGDAPQQMGMIIGILILVLWVFGMPFGMSALLWVRSRRLASRNLTLLQSPRYLRQYGLLYATYKAHLFLFMPFHIVRRAIAVVVEAVLMQYPLGRTTAIALVMIFFLSLHQALRPFNEDYSRYNALESAMLFGLVLLALTEMVANSQSVVAARLSGAADFVSAVQGVLIVGAFAWVVIASILLFRAKLGGVAPAAREWTRDMIRRASSTGSMRRVVAQMSRRSSRTSVSCETMNPIGSVEMTDVRRQVSKSSLASSPVSTRGHTPVSRGSR